MLVFLFSCGQNSQNNLEISSETQTGATESSTGATSSGQNTPLIQLIQEDEKTICFKEICVDKKKPFVEKDGKSMQVQKLWIE